MADEPPLNLRQNTRARPDQTTAYGRPSSLAPALVVRVFSKFQNFVPVALSEPNLSDAHDDEWVFGRPLGRGGFGSVSLWVRQNVDGVQIDECALKECAWEDENVYVGLPDVPSEAVYQHQLNELPDSQSIVRLRRYKYYEREGRTRMIFDACAHGDLGRLLQMYRMLDRYLPETFLWHVFNALACAIEKFQYGGRPWKEYVTGVDLAKDPRFIGDIRVPDDGAYLLHFDLKPDNVFLGRSPMEKGEGKATRPRDWLPSVQVGDFGLALLTDTDHARNPTGFWSRGTDGFLPPEQRHVGVEWRHPPQGVPKAEDPATACQNEQENPQLRFLPAFNVWGIGKIMSDLMFLDDGRDELSSLNYINPQQAEAQYADFHILPPRNTLRNPEYSEALKNLLRRCTRIDMRARPTATELVTETEQQLKMWLRKDKRKRGSQPTKRRKGEKVYCKGYTINKLGPSRHEIFPVNRGELRQLLADKIYENVDDFDSLRLGPKWDLMVRQEAGDRGRLGWWYQHPRSLARYEAGRINFERPLGPHQLNPFANRALSPDSDVLPDSHDDDVPNQQGLTRSENEKIMAIYRQLEKETGRVALDRRDQRPARSIPDLLVRNALAGEGTVGKATAVLRWIRRADTSTLQVEPGEGPNQHPWRAGWSQHLDLQRNPHLHVDFWPIREQYPDINHRVIMYLLWKDRAARHANPNRIQLVCGQLAQLYPL